MKIVLIILLSFITTGQLFAECAIDGLWALPQKGTIKQNSLIVLTGYFRSQKIVTSLNENYPIYLESEGHRVKLNVKKRYKGLFELTQAILEPEEELIAGRTYQLKIDKLDEFETSRLRRWNSELGKYEPITWKVDGGIDTESPELLNVPELVDKRTIHYGCGPAIYADFKIQTKDESELLVKTELVDLKSGESTTYFLNFEGTDTLSVGRGMCSGAFSYKENRKYKVRFSLMDICGNENEKWTAWIQFDSPYEGL
ncbi:hypothetical protein [Croceimicrobium sp.]|uniref:hypothetical protein n=1 Tax=Croceimicrobium sp. TaxID=2828340 RepID=UPI003BAA624F